MVIAFFSCDESGSQLSLSYKDRIMKSLTDDGIEFTIKDTTGFEGGGKFDSLSGIFISSHTYKCQYSNSYGEYDSMQSSKIITIITAILKHRHTVELYRDGIGYVWENDSISVSLLNECLGENGLLTLTFFQNKPFLNRYPNQ